MRAFLFSACACAMISGCGTAPAPVESPRGVGEARAMQTAQWGPIVTQIRALESQRGSRAAWRQKAQFEEVVRTREDLNAVVEGMALSDLAEVEAVQLFQRSALTAHYGFPANFHALVFFDASGRMLRVLR